MIGLKEISLALFWAVFVVIAVENDESAMFDRPYDLVMDPVERKMPDIMDRQRRLSVIKSLIDGLENKMMKRMSYGPCLGAGMSHNCEFGDLKQALNHVQQISSSHFPGRRKRSDFHRENENKSTTNSN